MKEKAKVFIGRIVTSHSHDREKKIKRVKYNSNHTALVYSISYCSDDNYDVEIRGKAGIEDAEVESFLLETISTVSPFGKEPLICVIRLLSSR
eukprot:scaffold16160_cov54-Cylindrotheca_fusiformis.AAC.2